MDQTREQTVDIGLNEVTLKGNLTVPPSATALVVFAHGSGSSRLSSRNRYVARLLQEANLGTLLFDLLTPEEEIEEQYTRHLRFDITLLAQRLAGTIRWLDQQSELSKVQIGYFGASTGGGAAIVAGAALGDRVGAIVSRGGRPDLAGEALAHLAIPTLLIVGGNDTEVIKLNQNALSQMQPGIACLEIVSGATHLFEEPGTLDSAANLARDWFLRHLASGADLQGGN